MKEQEDSKIVDLIKWIKKNRKPFFTILTSVIVVALIVAFVLWLVAGFMWEWSDVAGILEAAASVFSGIVAIVATYKLPRKFGWGVFASILYVLFTGICVLILGFGKSKYVGDYKPV